MQASLSEADFNANNLMRKHPTCSDKFSQNLNFILVLVQLIVHLTERSSKLPELTLEKVQFYIFINSFNSRQFKGFSASHESLFIQLFPTLGNSVIGFAGYKLVIDSKIITNGIFSLSRDTLLVEILSVKSDEKIA